MIEYTVKVDADGNKFWYLNDKLHREDGPAIEYSAGTKFWYLDGKHHREDGPAVEYDNGTKYWYLNDKLHCKDGPAIEYFDGDKYWFLDGKEYTEQQFLALTAKKPEDIIGTASIKALLDAGYKISKG